MSQWSRARRKAEHHLSHRTDAELNLIPLIDILSVMVAFLLVYSADVEVVQNTQGVAIPHSTADAEPKQSVVVMITSEHLFVQGELVADVPSIREARTPLIEPLRAVLERPMLTAEGAAAPLDIASREITVMGDKGLPYEVVRKVMATCTAAAYGKISLAVLEKEKPVGSGGPRPA